MPRYCQFVAESRNLSYTLQASAYATQTSLVKFSALEIGCVSSINDSSCCHAFRNSAKFCLVNIHIDKIWWKSFDQTIRNAIETIRSRGCIHLRQQSIFSIYNHGAYRVFVFLCFPVDAKVLINVHMKWLVGGMKRQSTLLQW